MNTTPNAFRITSQDFDLGVKELVKTFQSCRDKNHDSSENEEDQSVTDSYEYLHQWGLRESFGMTYMIHPPVLVASYDNFLNYTSNSDDQCGHDDPTIHPQAENGDHEEEHEYQYDDVGDWIDDSVHVPTASFQNQEIYAPSDKNIETIGPVHGSSSHPSSAERKWGNHNTLQYIEWKFSIVYSHVWGVPVLYFEVHMLDGQPLPRDRLLRHLNRLSSSLSSPSPSWHSTHSSPMSTTQSTTANLVEHNKEICNDDHAIEEHWTFVSYEEHPITGIPSFFLHPCQTSKRLQLVLVDIVPTSHAHGSTNRDESESVVTPKSAPEPKSNPMMRYKERHNISGCVILTWLSMILPAAGFRISANVFQQIDSELLCNQL